MLPLTICDTLGGTRFLFAFMSVLVRLDCGSRLMLHSNGVGHATGKLVVNMAAPATEHVRNIVLVGQDGAGKTSLAEAMLHVSGRTPRMGTTHDGKSYLDYDEEEIRRKFTIGTSIAPIPYKDYKINLLDTSGHPDFIGDTLATMQAAEMALFVVDAVAGPQVMTTKLWREAESMRLSRAVFINHIDRENADFDTAMALLHARFGSRLGPVTIPIGVDKDFQGVIDIIRMKARYFDQGSDAERVEDIPPRPRATSCATSWPKPTTSS